MNKNRGIFFLPMRERVVITGMGIISCLGNSLKQVTASLREGYCGIELIPERKELGLNLNAVKTQHLNF